MVVKKILKYLTFIKNNKNCNSYNKLSLDIHIYV